MDSYSTLKVQIEAMPDSKRGRRIVFNYGIILELELELKSIN